LTWVDACCMDTNVSINIHNQVYPSDQSTDHMHTLIIHI